MKSGYQKLYWLVFALLAAFTALLIWQIKKARETETKRSARPLVEEFSLDIPSSPDDPIFGNQGAALTIVEFIDLNKPDQLLLHQKIKNFVAKHPSEVRLIWKNDPQQSFWSADKNKIHRAGICVFQQNKNNFWSFVDDLGQHKKINDEELVNLINKYVTDQTAAQNCLTSVETEKKIAETLIYVKSWELPSPPLIFINNKLVNYLDEININELLEKIITPLPE
jgi:protein-disulfide isomerase